MPVPPLCRFHKLIWGSFGNGLLEGSGAIAGGGDNGTITVYSVTHILSSGKEPVIAQTQKHTGAVRALDFNPFQVLPFIWSHVAKPEPHRSERMRSRALSLPKW